MASGRRDYWVGFETGKSIYAPYQNETFLGGAETVASGATEIIIEYTVPTGYKYHIGTIIISCPLPGINQCFFTFGGQQAPTLWFDVMGIVNFSDVADHAVAAGGLVKMSAKNQDTESQILYGYIAGFLENLT